MVNLVTQQPFKFLIVIIGPTAIGKTTISIELANLFHTEIISADSRQFYKELKIGTASPSLDQLAQVRHHFIGHLNVTDPYNVYKFETDVLNLLTTLYSSKKYVVLVGGSGLYIDAVCKGIDVLPDPDPDLRKYLQEKWKKEGIASLQKDLSTLDPEYFTVVDKHNPKRLMRALEVCMTTGKKFSELRLSKPKARNYITVKIGLDLPREELFARINQRVDQMIEDGLIDEARSLWPYRHLNALNTVGYKELFEYLDGRIALDKAIGKIKTDSRHYAKRQLTWFKKDQDIMWFSPHECHAIVTYIKNRLRIHGV
ncbi:MAG: tRNA (adenosine(37)-N6)-dimethylallyltransferase MiaA [Bacteroidetes bacterium]|nr:tRNA (adenosine(37)-N6)-dimethylallyltransferase MiaA [Bacteroidota bacterium]